MKKINLACGGKLCLLPDWENVDFQNSGKNVKSMNLTKKLKYENDSINIICNFVGSQEIGCAHKSSEGRGSSSTL